MKKNNKSTKKKFTKSLLDKNFNLDSEYFDKPLSSQEWNKIEDFLEKFIQGKNTPDLISFFKGYPNIFKGEENKRKLRQICDSKGAANGAKIERFIEANKYIVDTYFIPKPSVLKTVFFPGEEKENIVVNMVRTCMYSLDVCLFTMTNDKLFEAVEECWLANVDVRVITDDECVKQKGSDVCKLAASGVPVKTDSNAQYHMHHKFVIIDKKVLITGSFNWTVQAVKNNNENVLIIENKEAVTAYLNEFNRMWKTFTEEVTKEEGIEGMKNNK